MWLFTKEAAVGITRTIVPFIYSWLLAKVPAVITLAESVGIDEAAMALLLGSLLYAAIRALAEKIPQIGYLLIFNTKPSYAGVVETPPVPPAQ